MQIVQVIREFHGESGSSRVAAKLGESFDDLGQAHREIYLKDYRPRYTSSVSEKIGLLRDVIAFSFSATLKLRKTASHELSLVHNEALGGDIYVDHGLHKEVVRQNPKLLIKNPIHLFLLMREALRHRLGLYRRIVVLSDFSKRVLLKNYPYIPKEKIVFIPNGVDLERFQAPRKREQNIFRLVFIGHEFDRKGLHHVFDALEQLDERFVLRVIGGHDALINEYKQKAEKRGVGSRVEFLGRRNDIPELLVDCDALALPSFSEAWPLVVLEAMAAGVPVVMTDVGCSKEAIRDGENGYVVAPDGVEIAASLTLMAKDDATRVAMERSARTTAQKYSWDTIAQQYIDLATDVWSERENMEHS